MESQQTEVSQSSSESVSSSPDLSSAIESISKEAPKLSQPTGLDKLKSQKAQVEKAESTPAKSNLPVKTNPVQGDPASGAPAAFTPDFKYKASGKEMEIPEKFRALITDKESEEEIKKLFGQAGTLPELKTENGTLKKNLGEVGGALNQYQSEVQQLRQIAGKNDWDTWFKKLNIEPERIYQWVLDKVNYNQLPPDQKAQMDREREFRTQAEAAQSQVSQVTHREMQLAVQMKGMQLEQTLGKADVKSMSDSFDSRVGRPGAFREAVIEYGKSVWALSNHTVDLTPEQAVADFVKKYGITSLGASPNPAAEVATQGVPTQSANGQPPVKVIPNVAGRSASPVKQKPKNLDDLRRLRDQAIKEDNASRNPSQGYLAG